MKGQRYDKSVEMFQRVIKGESFDNVVWYGGLPKTRFIMGHEINKHLITNPTFKTKEEAITHYGPDSDTNWICWIEVVSEI